MTSAIDTQLRNSGAKFGPVSDVSAPTAVLDVNRISSAAVLVGVLALAAIAAIGFAAPGKTGWAYQERADGRDLRVDFMRGVAMVFVVVDHIGMPSLFHLLSYERIGVVSGAELFVLLSGAVLGLAYRRRMERDGWVNTSPRIFRRAGSLYLAAVCVSLAAYAVSFVPRGDASMLTTWTDKSTSIVYRLYPSPRQTDVFARSVMFLRSGPSQFNIMGLYVVLMLLAPFILFLLAAPRSQPPGLNASIAVGALWERRRFAIPVLLVVSWGLYALQQLHPINLFHAQFEDPFPLLAWQVLFVSGMTFGYYRHELLAWFRTRLGTAVLAGCVIISAAGAFFAWNNPYLESDWDVRLHVIPAFDFARIYDRWFQRAKLEPGRALNTICVTIVLYGFLTICWKPLNRAFGWLLIPIGAASLYVFIWQVFLAMIVANIAIFQRENVLIDTLGHAIAILAVWAMVKRGFLYKIIPR